jgi:hypothetical protein
VSGLQVPFNCTDPLLSSLQPIRPPQAQAIFFRRRNQKSPEEHYEEAAGRNAYSITRCASAYHGCMLEACRALNAASIFVFRELPSHVWTGCVKDWIKLIVIGVRNSIGDHAGRREIELEAVGSEWARALVGRV